MTSAPPESSRKIGFLFKVYLLSVLATIVVLICLFPFWSGVVIAALVILGAFVSAMMPAQPKITRTETIRIKE